MAIDSKKIGSRIKQYRLEKGMTQEDLADQAGTVSKHISNLELGYKLPGLEMLLMIANALDVSPDDLLKDNLSYTDALERNALIDLLHKCSDRQKKICFCTFHFLEHLFDEFKI